jgi:hypothetical protein
MFYNHEGVSSEPGPLHRFGLVALSRHDGHYSKRVFGEHRMSLSLDHYKRSISVL